MHRILAPLTALVAVVAFLPTASQAASLEVEVRDVEFRPRVLQAAAGDTVTWTWLGSLQHNVVAYSGDSFRSSTQRMGAFADTFPGGTVLYRCTLHSTIDQGPCNGMCGIISDDSAPPPTPTIATPAPGAIVGSPTRVTGTAPDAETVIVREGSSFRGEAVVDQDGLWSIELTLPDGPHALHAIARSSIGIESAPGDAVSFTVDATAPTVTISSPSMLAVTGDPAAAAGTAADERSLATVVLELTDLLLGGTSQTTATVASDGTWTASVDAPHPGPYRLIATARDAVGNTTATEPVTFLVGLGL